VRRKIICLREYEFPQKTAVIQKLIIFSVQLRLQLRRAVIHADQMSLDDPAKLQERISTLIIAQLEASAVST
jgi:hypothetical protein